MSSPEERPSLAELGERARTAVGWRALGQFSNQGIQIVTSIVLARLLMPDDFGIVGMAAIVTGLAGVFRDLGFGQALVQRPELREEHKRSAFWVTLMMAGLLYGGMYLAAPYAGQYFRDERMPPVLRIMALSFLMAPFSVVPRSLLQRDIDFKRPFFADLAGTIAYGSVGITSAILGYGYWSLVWALLASSAVGTVAICIIVRYVPPLIPSVRGARDLVAFGIGVTGSGLLGYISTRVDYFVIARQLSATALGFYERAYKLIEYPASFTSRMLYPILFPSYSRLQHHPERLRRAFGRTLTTVSLVGFPLLALLAASAPELIPVVLGEQWTDAIAPTQIMVVAGAVFIVFNPAGALIKATGFIYVEVWLQVTRSLLLAGATWIGASQGIVGVAWGVMLANCVQAIINVAALRKCAGIGLRHYLTRLRGTVGLAAFVFVVGEGARFVVVATCTPSTTLVLTVATGCLAAAAYLRWAPFGEVADVWHDLLRTSRKWPETIGRSGG